MITIVSDGLYGSQVLLFLFHFVKLCNFISDFMLLAILENPTDSHEKYC